MTFVVMVIVIIIIMIRMMCLRMVFKMVMVIIIISIRRIRCLRRQRSFPPIGPRSRRQASPKHWSECHTESVFFFSSEYAFILEWNYTSIVDTNTCRAKMSVCQVLNQSRWPNLQIISRAVSWAGQFTDGNLNSLKMDQNVYLLSIHLLGMFPNNFPLLLDNQRKVCSVFIDLK